jgi:uncharacterized protein with GYD domain
MATYVALLNWTDQGIKNVKDTTKRASAAGDAMQKMGVTLKETYWTLGTYDVVAVMEAPDDETLTAALMRLGAEGNTRTTTMRAFTSSEVDGIISRAG